MAQYLCDVLQLGDTLIFKNGKEYVYKGHKKNRILGLCRKMVNKNGEVQLLSSRMNDIELKKISDHKWQWQ